MDPWVPTTGVRIYVLRVRFLSFQRWTQLMGACRHTYWEPSAAPKNPMQNWPRKYHQVYLYGTLCWTFGNRTTDYATLQIASALLNWCQLMGNSNLSSRRAPKPIFGCYFYSGGTWCPYDFDRSKGVYMNIIQQWFSVEGWLIRRPFAWDLPLPLYVGLPGANHFRLRAVTHTPRWEHLRKQRVPARKVKDKRFWLCRYYLTGFNSSKFCDFVS